VAARDLRRGAWLDVAIARVRLGRWLSPWIATGAPSPDGGLGLRGLVGAAGKVFVGWVYADPAGGTTTP
jgi:hypothetical protein